MTASFRESWQHADQRRVGKFAGVLLNSLATLTSHQSNRHHKTEPSWTLLRQPQSKAPCRRNRALGVGSALSGREILWSDRRQAQNTGLLDGCCKRVNCCPNQHGNPDEGETHCVDQTDEGGCDQQRDVLTNTRSIRVASNSTRGRSAGTSV